MQLLLFSPPPPPLPVIPGLRYLPEFCSEDEERALLEAIDRAPWTHEYRRRRQHYGVRYTPGGERLDDVTTLPTWVQGIAARAVERGLLPRFPDGCLVNEYLPGQGIAAHLDKPTGGPVVLSLSLGSPCAMELVPTEGEACRSIWLEPRSLLVLAEEARWKWKHGITPRKSDDYGGFRVPRGRRVSVTLRLRTADDGSPSAPPDGLVGLRT